MFCCSFAKGADDDSAFDGLYRYLEDLGCTGSLIAVNFEK